MNADVHLPVYVMQLGVTLQCNLKMFVTSLARIAWVVVDVNVDVHLHENVVDGVDVLVDADLHPGVHSDVEVEVSAGSRRCRCK